MKILLLPIAVSIALGLWLVSVGKEEQSENCSAARALAHAR